MYSDKQKYEFASLRAEGVSFIAISKKHNVPIIWLCMLLIIPNRMKRITMSQIKCHSFVIFLGFLINYVTVLSIPIFSLYDILITLFDII